MARPGKYNKYVSLSRAPQSQPDSDGFFEPLSPEYWWLSFEPAPPGGVDDQDRMVGVYCEGRYHPQVTIDTRIVYGSRELFVKGVQNLDDKGAVMRLYCEEVVP